MKRWKLLFTFALVLGSAGAAHAQDAALPPLPSDQKAKTLLQQMVTALGGDAWLNRSTWEMQGRVAGFYKNMAQGSTPVWFFHKAVPGTAGLDRTEQTKKRDIVTIWTADNGYEITFKGRKALPKDIVQDHFRIQHHSIDEVVRVWMKDPRTLYVYDGTSIVGRRMADKITLINGENDSVDLELESGTHLPLRRTFKWRNPTYKDFDEDVEEYEDYHVYDGVQTPLSTTRYRNGDMVTEKFLQSVKYNVALPENYFDINQPYNKHK